MIQDLPLSSLQSSKTNPRKHFDERKLAELAESIRANGILQPLLIRPLGNAYEIVAGERRFRAAKLAGVEQVPVVVRELSDEAVAEAQMIENGQREDVHPLEEAAGYHNLLRFGKRNVGWIAGRVGKSEKYVYDRMKLLELTKPAQQLFWDGEIDAGHAILLARLSPAQQKQVVDEEGALFEEAYFNFTPEEEETLPEKEQARRGRKARTVRELQHYIDEHFRFDPAKADSFLFPETTATVGEAAIKREKVVSITHQLHIQDEARDPKTRTVVPTFWRRADGKHDSKTCPHSIIGVVVCGPGRGDSFRVCMAKEKCAIHWGDWQKARAKAAKGGPTQADKWQQQQARDEERRRKDEAQRKAIQERWEKAQPALLKALAEKVKTLPTKVAGLLCQSLLDEVGRCDLTSKEAAKLIPVGTSPEQFLRHLGLIVLAERVTDWDAPSEFPKFAKSQLGIDVATILDQAAPVHAEVKDAKAKTGKKTKAA